MFDRDGTFLASWGEGLFVRPHGITVGPDDTVYCCDDKDHTVRKFTPDGRLVLISDLEAGDLVILEHSTRKELKRLKVGRQPAGILIEPDSSRAYVAVTGDDFTAARFTGVAGLGAGGFSWQESASPEMKTSIDASLLICMIY